MGNQEPAVIPQFALRLFAVCKQIERGDGSWNGGDLVSTVSNLLSKAGIDPDANTCPVCGATFTDDDPDDYDDAPERLGDHITAAHLPPDTAEATDGR